MNCLMRCCSREDQCFCGLVSIKIGAQITSAIGIALLFLLLAFDLVAFFLNKGTPLPLSWAPHLAILLTLILIGLIIYVLAFLGSLPLIPSYTVAFFIIFLVMNVIVLSFHLFFGCVALGFALSINELLTHNNKGHQNTTMFWQLGRAVLYLIVGVFEVYAELIVLRALRYWKRHEQDKVLEQLAQQEINRSRKKVKKNRVASVSFDSKA